MAIPSNEKKMSDGGRGRASLGMGVWKSSQKWRVQRSAVRSIAWLGRSASDAPIINDKSSTWLAEPSVNRGVATATFVAERKPISCRHEKWRIRTDVARELPAAAPPRLLLKPRPLGPKTRILVLHVSAQCGLSDLRHTDKRSYGPCDQVRYGCDEKTASPRRRRVSHGPNEKEVSYRHRQRAMLGVKRS